MINSVRGLFLWRTQVSWLCRVITQIWRVKPFKA